MKLRSIKANVTELDLGEGTKVLFSYEKPVAYTKLTPEGREYYRTNEDYSRTTTKHINSWLPKDLAEEVEQSVIDELVN